MKVFEFSIEFEKNPKYSNTNIYDTLSNFMKLITLSKTAAEMENIPRNFNQQYS